MRVYRTKIETQPMTNICYDYVDTKLIINVYRFIFIDLSCQIINQFSNRIELINRQSEQSAEDGTHLYSIDTLLFVGLLLQDTRLARRNDGLSKLRLDGYSTYDTPKSEKSHGMIILVHKDIPSELLEPQVQFGPDTESLSIRI